MLCCCAHTQQKEIEIMNKPKMIATCVVRDGNNEITHIGFDNQPPTPYNVALALTISKLTNLEMFKDKNGRNRLRQEGDKSLENNLDNLPHCN